MAHAVWSGVLSFGLVTVPVQMFGATESHTIRFHQLQRGTADRVRNKRVNERTGEDVPLSDIVKGYDIGDEYVVVEPEELDEVAPGRSKKLEISGFIDLDEIDPVYYDRTYYVGPRGDEYAKVYALLVEAMKKAGKAAIATFVMRNREYLVVVKPVNDVLVVHTLHWADEVRDPHREIGGLPENARVEKRELDTAVQLVDALSVDWDPQEYRDSYQERVRELLEAKRTGGTVEKEEPPPRSTNVIDLNEALRASVERAKGKRGTGGKKRAEAEKAGRAEKAGKKAEKAEKAEKATAEKATAKKRAKKPPEAADLAGLSKTALYELATEADIPGRSTMSREELVEALSATGGRRKARASA
ncbi:non-homologous end joining protein Ku [Streptomyces sp. RPT161]|uniref:non-homologous end joining protein Ku n=1 Tax=Streptomyces sp. RPT161 TaxID=3015993 RepID=UPI0022B8A9E8|nr:Ku protein [Streptomyces sp. RPT161]